jgi:isochorismate pyruvate lyase
MRVWVRSRVGRPTLQTCQYAIEGVAMPHEPDPHGRPLRRYLDSSYVPVCSSLAEVRKNIDMIDRQIVGLIAERGHFVKDAARFKRDAYQVSAPQRQQEVLDKVRALAEKEGAYPEVVEAAFRAMIAGFIAREQQDHLAMAEMENTK